MELEIINQCSLCVQTTMLLSKESHIGSERKKFCFVDGGVFSCHFVTLDTHNEYK